MGIPHHRGRIRRGQALTELALAIPIVLLLLFGLIEIGYMIKTKMVLQDAVRNAARYGGFAGATDGATGSTAPGCLADYAELADIQARLQSSIVNTAHVRSIMIYAANPASNTPRASQNPTHLASPLPSSFPNTDINADYYYADYNMNTGANVDDSGSTNMGTGKGAVYKLFNGGLDSIFATSPPSNYRTDPQEHPPRCGSAVTAPTCPFYDASHNDGINAGPSLGTCVSASDVGNWPPLWRNNQTDYNLTAGTPWPDYVGIDIVYDYQFQTPIFQVIGNLPFLNGTHMFRMDEHAVFPMDPKI